MGVRRWLSRAAAAVLAVAGAVAANQIFTDGVWRWWPWAPAAVVAALVSVLVADWLTQPSSADRRVVAGSVHEGQQEGPPAPSPNAARAYVDDSDEPASSTWPVRFGSVPPRAGCFQDRDLAELLAGHLERGDAVVLAGADMPSTHVLAGLGGVGKTQLAADHAHSLWAQQKVDVLAWITAGSRRDIQAAYAGMANRVGADVNGSGLSADDIVARLLNWLATTSRRWLIVLDDVVEPDDLRGLWPPSSPNGQVLVTTRRRDAALNGDHRRILSVGQFTPSEAFSYLVTRLPDHANSDEQGEIIALASDMGHLPLALAQAAAYLADRPLLTCVEYRRRLADRRVSLARVLPRKRELPDEQHLTVTATWSLSIERANHLDPVGLAKPLLELMSVLDAAGIPTDLFITRSIYSYLADRLGRSVNPGQVEDAIGCLYRLSLLSLDTDQPARAVRVHALVQRVTREGLTTDDLSTTAQVAAKAILEIWPGQEYALRTALRSNVEFLFQHARTCLWASDTRPLILLATDDMADQFVYAGTYLSELLDEAIQQIGIDHPDTLIIRDRLANCHAEAGDFHRAATHAEHLLASRLRLFGSTHTDTLSARMNLARWHAKAGNSNDAQTELEELKSAQAKVSGPGDRGTLETRLELALARSNAGDPATATTELNQLIVDLAQLFGPRHAFLLHARAHLVAVRVQAGQFVLATAEFEQLIADRIRIIPPCNRIIPILDHYHTSHFDHEGRGDGWNIQRTELSFDVTGIPYRYDYRYLLSRYDGINGGAAYHTEEAIEALMVLIPDALFAWGDESPLPLAMRHSLAKWQEWSGDNIGAIIEWELLAADQLRMLGADHSDTEASVERCEVLKAENGDLRPVQLWSRRRDRRIALELTYKRPRRWPSRAPIDETLRALRKQAPPGT